MSSKSKTALGPVPRLDAMNLAGVTDLMNVQHLRKDIDKSAVEKAVMGRGEAGGSKHREVDPVKIYTQELNNLAEELGIDFMDDEVDDDSDDDTAVAGKDDAKKKPKDKKRGGGDAKTHRQPTPLHSKTVSDLLKDLDLDIPGSTDSDDNSTDSDDNSDDSDASDASDDSDSDSDDSDSDSDSGSGSDSDSSVISNLEKDLGIDHDRTKAHIKRRNKIHATGSLKNDRRHRKTITTEQQRRNHINSVMGDMRRETRTTFGVENERAQDIKAHKLEQVENLRAILEEDGIDCSSITLPTMTASMDEINSALNILKLRNDRNRYSSIAEEIILGVAEGIETVFDGTREIPVVGWKPDYTGYHNTVSVKLHRMRYETSQLVNEVVEKYNIGPMARLGLEFLPSFVLYPRQRSRERGAPGLDADPDLRGGGGPRVADARGAYSAVRTAQARDMQSLNDV